MNSHEETVQIKPSVRQSTIVREIGSFLRELEETKRTKNIVYFSQLIGRKIYDGKGKYVGKMNDMVVTSGEKFPLVEAFTYKHNESLNKIMWRYVAEFNKDITLSIIYDQIPKEKIQENDILIADNLLDKQLVDINGLKVIRVNDVALAKTKDKINLVSIDIGMRGILRRLGLNRIGELLKLKDELVSWNDIEPLHDSLKRIMIKMPVQRLSDLHPADVADLLEELSMKEQQSIFKSLKSKTAALILEEAEDFVKKSIVYRLDEKRIALIIENMSRHKAADLLSLVDEEKRERLISFMSSDVAIVIRERLHYPGGSAGRLLSQRYVAVQRKSTLGNTIESLREIETKPRILHYVYVVDNDNSLVGVLSLRDVLLSNPNSLADEIMRRRVVSIKTRTPVSLAKNLMAKYNLLALPVLDSKHHLKGILNIEDVLQESSQHNKLHNESFSESKIEPTNNLFKDIKQVLRDIDKFMGLKHVEKLRKLKDKNILEFDKNKIIEYNGIKK